LLEVKAVKVVKNEASFTQQALAQAVQNPVYMPFLGRSSCPITRPLYEAELHATDISSAFSLLDSISLRDPIAGIIYSDHPVTVDDIVIHRRDAPLYARKRQFATRKAYMHSYNPEPMPENNHVSE
jgi:CRISPR system Cascade subunit CasD